MKYNPEVDEFLKKKNHPRTDEIQRVREIIMSADDRIDEAIKWSSPTFMYKGNMASFFMNAKKHISLMFHKGVLIDDHTGLLEGAGKEGRTARFESIEDVENKKKALQSVVKGWITVMDNV